MCRFKKDPENVEIHFSRSNSCLHYKIMGQKSFLPFREKWYLPYDIVCLNQTLNLVYHYLLNLQED